MRFYSTHFNVSIEKKIIFLKILDREGLLKGKAIGHPKYLRLILINYAICLISFI